MNNDLISREALRKAFHERIYYFNKSSWDEANAIIDNAPTVEGYKNVIVGGMNNPYNAGYMDGIRQAYKELEEMERPTGEWILQTYERFNSGNELYKYECNKCGHREEHAYSDSKLPNFCPNCGADMKGGE